MKTTVITDKDKRVVDIIIYTKDRILRRKINRMTIDYMKDDIRMYVDKEDEETITIVAYNMDRDKKINIEKIMKDIQKELNSMEVKEYELKEE